VSLRRLAAIAALATTLSWCLSSSGLPAPPPRLSRAERCASLEKQFSEAMKSSKARKNVDAQKLGEAGRKLCASKRYSLGERKLIAALTDLGVKADI
jgi:hypothetical protein